jgi:hypothetical protein
MGWFFHRNVIVNDLFMIIQPAHCTRHILNHGPWEAFSSDGLDIGRTENNGKWDLEARRHSGLVDASSK